MCEKQKVTLQELIMAAMCQLQRKNGVTACEIAEYVADKRGCKLDQILGMIKIILCKAKNKDILCENKGLFRINESYDDPLGDGDQKTNDNVSIDMSDDDSDEDEDDSKEKPPNPCACIKFSKENLEEKDNAQNDSSDAKKKRKVC